MRQFSLDPKSPPPLTPTQKRRLSKLAAIDDCEIDYSDLPASEPTETWVRPHQLVATENKQQITLRLDAQVVEFFRQTGPRYQSRINAVLRHYVAAQR